MTNDTITKTDAADLAHTYWLYRHAIDRHDDTGVTIYGDWLLSMQARMGVDLIDPLALKMTVASTHQRLDAVEA